MKSTAKEISDKLGVRTLCMPQPDAEVTGAYTGDLLSWVMGRATAGQAWVTIMTNLNIVAVASLKELPLVILCDGSVPEAEVIGRAVSQEINLVTTERSSYEICCALYDLLK